MNNYMIAVALMAICMAFALSGCATQPEGWISTTVEVG